MNTPSSSVARAVEHLRALIADGKRVAALERPSSYAPYIQGDDKIPLHAWLAQTKNIVERVFGTRSEHYRHLAELTKSQIEHSYEVLPIVGLLEGCKSDLEGGFLLRQEDLLSTALFDNVLEQAEHLLAAGHKDPAAVLGRVVLEDTLRRLAVETDLEDDQKASALNDALKKSGRISQPQWRLIQTWLDIGNAAAHGQFSSYETADVNRMLEQVRLFSARELGSRI